jgi:hypothetical protein
MRKSVHISGIKPDQTLGNTAFEIRTGRAVENVVPAGTELTRFQGKCDPHGLIFKKIIFFSFLDPGQGSGDRVPLSWGHVGRTRTGYPATVA